MMSFLFAVSNRVDRYQFMVCKVLSVCTSSVMVDYFRAVFSVYLLCVTLASQHEH